MISENQPLLKRMRKAAASMAEKDHIAAGKLDELDLYSNGNIQEAVVEDEREETQPVTEQHESWDPRWVTVEPVIFLFMFSWGIHSPAINGLTYRYGIESKQNCVFLTAFRTCILLVNALDPNLLWRSFHTGRCVCGK